MRKTLEEVENYPEVEVRKTIARVGMPFSEPLDDYKAFFRRVREKLF